MWEQMELNFAPRVWTMEDIKREYPELSAKGQETMLAIRNNDRTMERTNLERELTRINNPKAYLSDTKMGYKILVHDCERCDRGADTDIIRHYNCEGSTFHGSHCTRNSCF